MRRNNNFGKLKTRFRCTIAVRGAVSRRGGKKKKRSDPECWRDEGPFRIRSTINQSHRGLTTFGLRATTMVAWSAAKRNAAGGLYS